MNTFKLQKDPEAEKLLISLKDVPDHKGSILRANILEKNFFLANILKSRDKVGKKLMQNLSNETVQMS
jgi:hypothetical protein